MILANVKLTKSEKQVRDGGRRSEERTYYINWHWSTNILKK